MTDNFSPVQPCYNRGVSLASLLTSENDSDVQFVANTSSADLISRTPIDEFEKNAGPSTIGRVNCTSSFSCDPVASFLFTRDGEKKRFRISRNIYAEQVDIASAPPAYFPVSPNGFATFVNLDGYDVRSVQEFVEGSPYSVRGKAEKKSSVIFCNDRKYSVWRKTVTCSGIKACSTSLGKCSVSHCGPWKPSKDELDNHYDDTTVDWEYEKAVQVFFCGQNMFPLICKHVRVRDSIDYLRKSGGEVECQKRLPNWVFKQGKKISFSRNRKDRYGGTISSKLPDYFGCAEFGKPGVTNSKNCDLVPLPASLQGANPDLVEEICARARQGIFPTSKRSRGDCPPLRVTFTGKHCPRSIHLQETCVVRRVECDVEYHYLFHQLEDKSFSWVVVVGVGVHKHTWPLARPPP